MIGHSLTPFHFFKCALQASFLCNTLCVLSAHDLLLKKLETVIAGGSFSMNNGIFENTGDAFNQSFQVSLTGGSFTNIASSIFAKCSQNGLVINGPSFNGFSAAGCQIGPCPLLMQNGSLQNNGLLALDLLTFDGASWTRGNALSAISGGNLSGSGIIWVSGDLGLESDVSQSSIAVGRGFDTATISSPVDTSGLLWINNVSLSAPLEVTSQGVVKGVGTVSLIGSMPGLFYPGLGLTSTGQLNVQSPVAFTGAQSGLSVNLDGTSSSLLNVNASLSFDSSSSIYLKSINNPPLGYKSYVIASGSSITGSTPNLVNQSIYNYPVYLTFEGNNLVLSVDYPTGIAIPNTSNPNLIEVVRVLNEISGNCLPATQYWINKIIALPQQKQIDALIGLIPVFKKAQFALEKLDLLLHKEIGDYLYNSEDGVNPFVFAGFDSLKQTGQKSWNLGYTDNSYYQFFGASFGKKHHKGMLGIGFSESELTLIPHVAKGHFFTQYLAAGYCSNFNRFSWGIDALFASAKMKASRDLDYYDLNAKNTHNLWNGSIEGVAKFHILKKFVSFDLYDEVGYNYGKEKPYQELGAPGLNQFVNREKISVFRNALGFVFATSKDKIVSGFLDGAWVMDRYINSKYFYSAFVGTNVYGHYQDYYPTTNLARIHTGVCVNFKHLEIDVDYTGLFGTRFSENSISLKANFKF